MANTTGCYCYCVLFCAGCRSFLGTPFAYYFNRVGCQAVGNLYSRVRDLPICAGWSLQFVLLLGQETTPRPCNQTRVGSFCDCKTFDCGRSFVDMDMIPSLLRKSKKGPDRFGAFLNYVMTFYSVSWRNRLFSSPYPGLYISISPRSVCGISKQTLPSALPPGKSSRSNSSGMMPQSSL